MLSPVISSGRSCCRSSNLRLTLAENRPAHADSTTCDIFLRNLSPLHGSELDLFRDSRHRPRFKGQVNFLSAGHRDLAETLYFSLDFKTDKKMPTPFLSALKLPTAFNKGVSILGFRASTRFANF